MSTRKKKTTDSTAAAVATDKKGGSKEVGVEVIKREIEAEQKSKDTIEWSNVELERSVRAMEMNVLQLESGNYDVDDSEVRQRYENQKQLNVQLLEQKRWLEHELEQIKQKIQNEKMDLPDPFSFDWDNLSETELKRLVGQLEKTRNDLRSDLREMEWRLDKEGKEFHHHDDFCRMYQAEIKNLNRVLDSLMRTGVIPSGLQLQISQSISQSSSSFPSTGVPSPGGGGTTFPGSSAAPSRKSTSNATSPPTGRRRQQPQPQQSPTRRRNLSPPGKIDPKQQLGPTTITRKQVKALPKIEKRRTAEDARNAAAAAAELDPVEEDQEN